MLNEQNKKKNVETCDVGLTCDIIDESFHKPIIVAPTNPSYTTSTSTSSSSDGFTCDASLMVENVNLKKEVNKITHTLAKAYGGEDCLLMCLGSQRASLYKEGLSYIPKKGKAAFAPHKTSFVKNNGRFALVASKLVIKSTSARTRAKILMYPPLSLILSICLPMAQMV